MTVMVEWAKSKVVNFSVPVGQSDLDEIQAAWLIAGD
jgi:hypothetical protein